MANKCPGPCRERLFRCSEHAERRYSGNGPTFVPIEAQGPFKGGQGEFVDPERPQERVFLHWVDKRPLANDDASLRSPQQLVATEGDHVHPGPDVLLYCRLVAADERL